MENIQQFFGSIIAYLFALHSSFVLMKAIYMIIFTLIGYFVADVFFRKMYKRLNSEKRRAYKSFFGYTRRPVKALILLLGFTLALESVTPDAYEVANIIITDIRVIGVIFILIRFMLRLISVYEDYLTGKSKREDSKLDKMTVDAITKLLRVTLFVVASLVLMQSLGLGIGGLLALGGAGGIGISLAAKDLLSNFFGAIMIYADKPFRVGETIRSPDREIAGTVEAIGWRLTKIRTFDKRLLLVPNSAFNIVSIENFAKMSHRRIREIVRIRYADIAKVTKITAQIKQMLEKHEGIDHSQTTIVNIEQFGENGIDILIYTFTHTVAWAEFYEVKQDVLCEVEKVINKNGASIAIPVRNITVTNSSTGNANSGVA